MQNIQRISPFLWFDNQAEEAANFYVSIFKNSKVNKITYYGEAGPGPKGSVMTVSFELDGQGFVALNGGTRSEFTESISFVVNCNTQQEVDEYREKLSEEGQKIQKIQCGWLKDKYGVSWQVTSIILIEIISDPDPKKSQRVMWAMFQMKKIDIEKLEPAYMQ
jgi:predicted 3-demethylubiquinone-9 3-methyltransferase (glyoxalase superfamily)